MTASKIEWTDRSDWNPIRGCTRVSPGCGGPGKAGGCYAEAMAARFSLPGMWGHGYAEMVASQPRWTGKVELQADRLTLPLSWKKPAKVFASSTSDFFHEQLTDADIDKLFAVMVLCPHLTFQVLTKRPERMRDYFAARRSGDPWAEAADYIADLRGLEDHPFVLEPKHIPLPNVWLGVSAERQQEADERIPLLLQTPAAVRFVSCEPLLGPLNIRPYLLDDNQRDEAEELDQRAMAGRLSEGAYRALQEQHSPAQKAGTGLDWVIAGGESGRNARPMHPDWVRSLRDQCAAAGVPFFFKQWGEHGTAAYHAGTGQPVFRQFTSFQHWVDKASTWVNGGICIDAAGRELRIGADFMRARDDGTFPVTVMHRLGKSRTGALLDGREHKAFPAIASAAKQSSQDGPPVAAWW